MGHLKQACVYLSKIHFQDEEQHIDRKKRGIKGLREGRRGGERTRETESEQEKEEEEQEKRR